MVVESKGEEFSQQDLQDMLKIYYKRLFPGKVFYRWLTYSHTEPNIFQNREFSFTLADDVYIRYLSYENCTEFENDLWTKNPFKIDIGAVMTIRPRDHRVGNVQPTQRELVFDMDMTDYDEVRTCCSGADICQKCWKFMVIACRILDESLREDFNFEHILWVFSGRRGIHCLVCDKTARHLDNKNRNAVAEYLNLFTQQNSSNRVTLGGDPMHHCMKRAHRIVDSYFDEICLNDQNIFGTMDGRKKLLELIPDENVRKTLEPQIMAVDSGDSDTVWDIVKRFVSAMEHKARTEKNMLRKLKFVIEEIQMSILCPLLDISLSKTANHLFCVHPKTGKICVPFNPAAVARFNKTTVPKLRQLLEEVDKFDKEAGSEQSNISLAYRKTAMYKNVQIFEEFLRKLESSHKTGAKLEISDAKMEFQFFAWRHRTRFTIRRYHHSLEICTFF